MKMGGGGGRGAPTPPPVGFTFRKDHILIVYEAGWAPESFWTGAENIAFIGIRSPYRPARS
jgi:hypothetical protein